MAEENNYALAQETFNTLCKMLDANDWHYDKNDDELTIKSGAQGDDLPVPFTFKVDAKRSLVLLLSEIPISVPESKRMDVAIAVSVVNFLLVDGSFDFDVKDGHLLFRMTNSFLDSKIGDTLLAYLLIASFKIIDRYNDKFLLLSTGAISLEQFIKTAK